MHINPNQDYFSQLPNDALDHVLWKIGKQGRDVFRCRVMNQALVKRTEDFILNTIYPIFKEVISFKTATPSLLERVQDIEKNVHDFMIGKYESNGEKPYQIQNIRDSLQLAEFFEVQAYFSKSMAIEPKKRQTYWNLAIDFMTQAGISEGQEKTAIEWLQEEYFGRDFSNLVKVHLGLSKIYARKTTNRNLALEHAHKAWNIGRAHAKDIFNDIGRLILLDFYDQDVGLISKQEVNKFFDELLDEQIVAVQNQDGKGIKWMLSILSKEAVLPAYYKKNYEKAAFIILKNLDLDRAGILTNYIFVNVIKKKLQAKLKIPEAVKFNIYHFQFPAEFIICLDEADNPYQENFKKIPLFRSLFHTQYVRESRFGDVKRSYKNCFVITEYSWNSFKRFLTADLNE